MNINDKYRFYESSVQNPEGDVDFINEKFKELQGRSPKSLREDFCGTGLLMSKWVQQGKDFYANGLDLDPEPVEYGKENHWSKLSDDEKNRMTYHLEDVFQADNHRADVVCAFNFSYFIFKKRKQLTDYFKAVRKAIHDDGVFFLDIFGGAECYEPLEEETEYDGFSYFWDLDKFNPINNEVQYYIHFEAEGKKHREVFSYDWRQWSIPEVREMLEEAGFSDTIVFWEGDDDDGGGNGEFYKSELEENCESWVCYIAAKA